MKGSLIRISSAGRCAPARLLFANGANWAGTVVANGCLALTNLVDGAGAAAVNFHALRLDGTLPIRVWKTGGTIVANDTVNLETAVAGFGRFVPVAMDEPFTDDDEIALGLYPADGRMPSHLSCRRGPVGPDGRAMLYAKCRRPASVPLVQGPSPDLYLEASGTEVVIAEDAPKTVVFAANELTNFLSQTFGAPVPLVRTPTAGRVPILLGEALWAIPEVSLAALARDGYAMAVRNGRVYLAGRDDPAVDPVAKLATPSWGAHYYEHATLNGVYAFLEKHAGCRFYFPGETGTCVPRRTRIGLHGGVTVDEPQHSIRTWSFYSDGAWPEGDEPVQTCHPQKALNVMRQRVSTENLSCCHGLNGFCYVERFGTTHPEYFALDANGNRMIEGTDYRRGHLCLSSAITNEIFRDCLSYLKGEDASVRGIPGMYADYSWGKKYDWHTNVSPLSIDLMPQDGDAECFCDACQAKMRAAGQSSRASELVWGMVKGVADRLAAEGYQPTITCMSYADYADTPAFALPDNIRVMVARTGPWMTADATTVAEDNAFYDKWTAFTGHRPWTWNYPNRTSCNRLTDFNIPGWAPAAWGRYYSGIASHVFGTFAESETERCLDHLLGYYLKAHLDWNAAYDWQTALREFYPYMFGPAAAPMRRALERVERKFIDGVAGNIQMTDVGPVVEIPSDYKVWCEIYSAAETAALRSDFDEAAAAVPTNSPAGRRIALFRQWMYDPPATRGAAYRASIDTDAGIARYRAKEAENLFGDDWWVGDGALRDTTVTCVTDESKQVHCETAGQGVWALSCRMKAGCTVKAGSTYRLSWFVKTDLAANASGGGAAMGVNIVGTDYSLSLTYPSAGGFLTGQVDWIAQSVEFTIPSDAPADTCVSVMPFIRYVTGRAWFDGLLLEEISSVDE